LQIGSAFGTAAISGAFFGAIGAHATPAGAASAARVAARARDALKKSGRLIVFMTARPEKLFCISHGIHFNGSPIYR
jgi:hypothetical protein